jgi:hypothetical protein
MKHNIIQTENYLLIVDNLEIKEGDWWYNKNTGLFFRVSINNVEMYNQPSNMDRTGLKKIIAHLPINSPILEGVDLLPPLEDNHEAICPYPEEKQNAVDWHNGYAKAKEKYKYTEGDMRKCWEACLDFNRPAGSDSGINFENFIQSLQQPKMPDGFECEDEVYMYSINGDIMKPKTTTNLQGFTEWVGKYIY